jgi:three-Cys-motif partner protein
MPVEVQKDPSDGLPASEAQEWAVEKHTLVCRYLGTSSEARRKFTRRTYVELFSGPGRQYIKGTNRFIDGSPLRAWKESQRTRTEFTEMHLADERQDFCDAVAKRLIDLGAKVKTHALRSEAAAKRIVRGLEKSGGMNVAFLDPFNLGDLPFTIIETFAQLKKIDLVIHVSAMDLIRQMPSAMKGTATSLDAFAPGWRNVIGHAPAGEETRGRFIEHWLTRIRALDFGDARVWKLIKGPTNQPLYWLVLVAKHPLAAHLWDEANKPPQGSLPF